MDEERKSNACTSETPDPSVSLDVIPLHSTNLLTVLDESGIVLYESPAITRVFGFDQDELVGEPVASYFHPDDRDAVLDAFENVVSGDSYSVESTEYRHQQADGSYRWVESVGSANPTPNGNYVVNTRDIEERKQREQSLQQSNERLDEFAHVVSHDLRNPLGVAQGNLEFVRQECDSAYLDRVEQAHGRMERLIGELLSLAQAGETIDSCDSVSIASVADRCWDTIATDHASLIVDVDRSIRASETRLQQLLENLIRNAIEHGGASVTITIGELSDNNGFFIEDDGSGIDTDQGCSVLVSGFSTSDGGTGYGLTIVQQIASAHGWEIDISDSEAGGVRVEFSGVDFA